MTTSDNEKFLLGMWERLRQEKVNGNRVSEAMLRDYITDETLINHVLASQESFPYYWVEMDELISEGDLVSVRGWFCGTHQGLFMGIPPTGKEVRVPMYVTYRIAGGKIVDHWMMMDREALMQQLGVQQIQDTQDG